MELDVRAFERVERNAWLSLAAAAPSYFAQSIGLEVRRLAARSRARSPHHGEVAIDVAIVANAHRFAGIPTSSSIIDEAGVPQLLNRGEQTARP